MSGQPRVDLLSVSAVSVVVFGHAAAIEEIAPPSTQGAGIGGRNSTARMQNVAVLQHHQFIMRRMGRNL